jgi:hypothetical protein
MEFEQLHFQSVLLSDCNTLHELEYGQNELLQLHLQLQVIIDELIILVYEKAIFHEQQALLILEMSIQQVNL